jgi:hypothetical protein
LRAFFFGFVFVSFVDGADADDDTDDVVGLSMVLAGIPGGGPQIKPKHRLGPAYAIHSLMV